MPLEINARINDQYGISTLINQKYSPLENITIPSAQQGAYQNLFNTQVSRNNPSDMVLYGHRDTIKQPNTNEAPMIVVSSGRATWMKEKLNNAQSREEGKPTGYNDQNTFRLGGEYSRQDMMPWYSPARSNRPLYVVVHHSEFDYYKDKLKDIKNTEVIGYKLTNRDDQNLDVVGFGASRAAAMHFAKTAGFDRAWMVDDNVVNINRFPNTLNDVEAHMRTNPNLTAIGFGATTKNEDHQGVFNDGGLNFAPPSNQYFTNAADTGLLQQAVLWNVDRLKTTNLNFSPAFVASNEDVSFSNLLQQKNMPIKLITEASIVKATPEADPSEGANRNAGHHTTIPNLRNQQLATLAQTGNGINIDLGNGKQTLTNTFPAEQGQDHLKKQVQAIEQIMSSGISTGLYRPHDPSQSAFNDSNMRTHLLRTSPTEAQSVPLQPVPISQPINHQALWQASIDHGNQANAQQNTRGLS